MSRLTQNVLAAWVMSGVLAQTSAAAPPDPLANLRCADAIRQQLRQWNAHGTPRLAPPAADAARHLWPTPVLGVWLELRTSAVGPNTLARVAADSITEIAWDDACRTSRRERRTPPEPAGGEPPFTDADLMREVSARPAVVIYLWSPHMPLSVDGLQQAQRAATRLGLPLRAIVDPRANAAFTARVAREAGLPDEARRPAASIDLVFRDLLVHAPSLLLYVHGRAAGTAIPGYRDAATYEALLRERLLIKEIR